MTTRAAPHWARIGESSFVFGMWLLYGVHRTLGRLPFRLCLYPVVAWYWATRPLARRSSLEYLRRLQAAHGGVCAPGREPGLGHSLRHFLSFAETILDKLLAFSGRYPFDAVRLAGLEAMQAMIARGQGGIFVTAHVGCLELCRALADRCPGLQLTLLVHTRHAERFNAMLRRLDPGSRIELLQVTEVDPATAALLARKVEAGGFVAIAGDRVPVMRSKVVRVPFLGHDADFPVGPYVLAALLKCPLVLLGCVREGRAHAVGFELLAERVELPRGRRDAALAAYAAAFAGRLERLLQRAPYDWFNFYPFWAPADGAHRP
ncbi:acyltransferase [Rubrivivax gelatinosus]|uniref:LpxL/LpxP family acyltransferase n=1 Tax=Rubrivivax gelatinosus TaxID=28068 RepID=UPI0019085EA1|nr:acyltransferase [Rubrivivax gelatinosus]MBK1612128.1 acyltransferase [Rubrivivax gelatinosus]